MLFQIIIKILFRKDVEEMAVVYATLIIKGKKDFADVPARIKEQVKTVRIDLDCGDLAEYQGNYHRHKFNRYMTVI